MSSRSRFEVSRLDRFLMSLFPEWGLRRVRARAQAFSVRQFYDAAASSRRTDGWRRTGGDVNASAVDLPTLRELSRDLLRNNGWARRGVNVIANNTVGWGIKPKAIRAPKSVLTEADRIWDDWSSSVACDYDGRLPFVGLERLAMKTIASSGELLGVRVLAGADDDLEIPIRVRLLEPDYFNTSKDGPLPNGGKIRQGIETDARGRRVAYHLYRNHPGADGFGGGFNDSVRVPAEDVIHVYDVERAGALHGVPWLCAAIAKLEDLDDYEDARLMQMKVAAAFGAFVEDLDVGFTSPLGQLIPGSDGGAQVTDSGIPIEWLEPGKIQYVPAGKKITFPQMPTTSDHGPFSASNLRRIAAGLDVTYEDMTGDYSQTNYSSARMGRIAHEQAVEVWRWTMLVPQFCDRVWRWVMEFASDVGFLSAAPRADWSAPPLPMLDAEKESRATATLIRTGQKTLFQVWREQGLDPQAQLRDMATANRELDRLGIVLDIDPRRVNAAGGAQLGGPLESTDEAAEPAALPPADDSETASSSEADDEPADIVEE